MASDNLPAEAGAATDVEIIDESQLEVVEAAIRSTDYRDVDQLVTVEDPQVTADAIVARILASESVDTAFAANKAVGARTLVGVPLRVNAVRWARSRFQQGAAVFAIVDAERMDGGEAIVVTTSARNALAQLLVAQRVDGFPVEGIAFQEGSETANGFRPMWLEWASARPAQVGSGT